MVVGSWLSLICVWMARVLRHCVRAHGPACVQGNHVSLSDDDAAFAASDSETEPQVRPPVAGAGHAAPDPGGLPSSCSASCGSTRRPSQRSELASDPPLPLTIFLSQYASLNTPPTPDFSHCRYCRLPTFKDMVRRSHAQAAIWRSGTSVGVRQHRRWRRMGVGAGWRQASLVLFVTCVFRSRRRLSLQQGIDLLRRPLAKPSPDGRCWTPASSLSPTTVCACGRRMRS